ncbi:MAG TPA: hypothetical protein VIB62_02115 [Actinomycetota bacterium]
MDAPDPPPEVPAQPEPSEGLRALHAIGLGVALGLVLALLGRRSDQAR